MERKSIKRFIEFAVICMLVILVSGGKVKAAGETKDSEILVSGDYQYTVLDDGTVSIAKYTGDSSTVWIPKWIDGKRVTEIGEQAFYRNLNINSVYFPNSIEKILAAAFSGCNNLRYVDFNWGLKSLGDSSFLSCGLYTVKIPGTVSNMEPSVFCFNQELKYVEVSEGVSEISEGMFSGCIALEYIEIGQSVRVLEKEALDYCISFKGFITSKIPKYESDFCVIPSQVVKIGKGNFKNCYHLEKFVILNDSPVLSVQCIPQNSFIYGYKNTVAERYANTYGNEFVEFVQTKQITLNNKSLELQLGQTETSRLTVHYSPENATIQEVVWTSSNPNVATVDKWGNIKAISNGTAVISARTFDESDLRQECVVTITTALKDISLNKQELYLNLSNTKSVYLSAEPQPSQASIENITWKSSNTNVATVSANGKVTAKGAGKAKITATINGKSKVCTVYIAPKQVENLKVSKSKTDSITLSWSKVKQASGYKIYAYSEKSKKYVYIKNCSSQISSYTIKKVDGKNLTSAKQYKFKVCPYITLDNKKIESNDSYIKGYTLPKQAKITSIKRKNNGKSLEVKWNSISKASYYEIYISNSKTKEYKCVKQIKTNSYTIKGLSKNKTYYIKVRAVSEVSGKKIKGEYSEVKRK